MYETRNTRLAAALVSLGYEIQEVPIFANGAVISLSFHEKAEAEPIVIKEAKWRDCGDSLSVEPLILMHKVCTARDWIMARVVHGTHNRDVTPPEETCRTRNLNFACCLVAQEYYLIKLDKIERVFHFDRRATDLWDRYRNPEPNSVWEWQIKYLRNFDWLLRSISNRKLVLDNRPAIGKDSDKLKRDTEKRELAT